MSGVVGLPGSVGGSPPVRHSEGHVVVFPALWDANFTNTDGGAGYIHMFTGRIFVASNNVN